MNRIQDAKRLVLEYFDAFEASSVNEISATMANYALDAYEFRGVHPFNELSGVQAVATSVWQPIRQAFHALERRQDIFMAGRNRIDDSLWVTSMGKFMGLFDESWLGIPPTGRIALLPYCEFHRIENKKIAESALWIDIISVMKQADLQPLPDQTGANIVNPGPRTNDGILLRLQQQSESQRTLDLIMRMCNDLVSDGMESPQDQLAKTWHGDMIWFGPSGIGATYTLPRYQAQHQGPFQDGLQDIAFNGHVLEHAEGAYGAWFGWPNLRMLQGDGFLGLPASTRPTEMRVVDVYRRDGNKLAENWVFIDLLHYLKLLGVDVLERQQSMGPNRAR